MARLAILIFCVFSITTGEFVIAGILPEVGADLGVTIGTAGLLVTAYALGMIIGGPVLTACTTAVDRKSLMLTLLAVAAVGNTISALAPSFSLLLAARVITALVTSTFFAQAIVVAVQSAPAGRAGTAVSRLAFGMSLAMIIGAPIGTVIGGLCGWRATFAVIAAACLAGIVMVQMRIQLPHEAARPSAVSELRVLRQRPVILALAVTAAGNVGVLMVFSYLAPLLTQLAGHSAARLPVLLLGFGIAATIGNLAGGLLYDRNPRLFQPVLLGVLGLVLAGAWYASQDQIPSVIAILAIGALGFAIVPGMQAQVMRTAAKAPTLAMAVNASAYQVAAACAGLFGGVLVDSAAGPRVIYPAAAALTVSGLALTLIAAPSRRQKTSEAESAGSAMVGGS